jgi:hypothetical protein
MVILRRRFSLARGHKSQTGTRGEEIVTKVLWSFPHRQKYQPIFLPTSPPSCLVSYPSRLQRSPPDTLSPPVTAEQRAAHRPPPEMIDDVEEYLVDYIVDKKIMRGRTFYKVWWKGYSPYDDSWEPKANLDHAQDAIADFNDAHPSRPIRSRFSSSSSSPHIILAISPKWASAIRDGSKLHEFWKSMLPPDVRFAWLYETGPVFGISTLVASLLTSPIRSTLSIISLVLSLPLSSSLISRFVFPIAGVLLPPALSAPSLGFCLRSAALLAPPRCLGPRVLSRSSVCFVVTVIGCLFLCLFFSRSFSSRLLGIRFLFQPCCHSNHQSSQTASGHTSKRGTPRCWSRTWSIKPCSPFWMLCNDSAERCLLFCFSAPHPST